MRFSLRKDDFGRLECVLGDGQEQHSVFGADPETALDDLSAALDDLETSGSGECVWLVSSGEYRWVLRRVDDRVRLAVMFLHSVAVGYQHVYWGEHPLVEVLDQCRAEIRRAREAA
ncbi:MAG: hypothetical protein ACOYX1_00580 [Acidobacteriota bacterium]